MKKLVDILTWVGLLGGIALLLGFAEKKKDLQETSSLEIHIEQADESGFITEKDVQNLFTNQGYATTGHLMNDIDIQHLEQLLRNKSSVETAEVFTSIDGKIVVNITERTPIIRIYNDQNESFYLDQYGSLMPLSHQFAARVLIANGSINIPFSTVNRLEDLENDLSRIFRQSNTTAVQNTSLIAQLEVQKEELPGATQLKELFDLALYIHQNPFWKAQISQVYVNDNGEFELQPRVGNHSILLGKANRLEEKFDKLLLFYQQGLSKTGWNEYSTLNLKYKNQVVCTKR
ncbi:hypothetical protein KFE98_09400 [bacterium SCSIO 12741]|nr:hypothetical protein KFE98_09400 [bacterium SCSIO 12741]